MHANTVYIFRVFFPLSGLIGKLFHLLGSVGGLGAIFLNLFLFVLEGPDPKRDEVKCSAANIASSKTVNQWQWGVKTLALMSRFLRRACISLVAPSHSVRITCFCACSLWRNLWLSVWGCPNPECRSVSWQSSRAEDSGMSCLSNVK